MNIASISPFIALDAKRSALLDVKQRVLLLTLERILYRFGYELSEALRLLAGSDIHIRFDPMNSNPCLVFEDIPRFLSLISQPHNSAHITQEHNMRLECSELSFVLETMNLLSQPRMLSRQLVLTQRLGGFIDRTEMADLLAFTREVAAC